MAELEIPLTSQLVRITVSLLRFKARECGDYPVQNLRNSTIYQKTQYNIGRGIVKVSPFLDSDIRFLVITVFGSSV